MATHPQHVVVWTEIPVSNLEKSTAFYNAVLDQEMTIDTSGPFPKATLMPQSLDTGISAHFYEGKTAETDLIVHYAAPDKDLDVTRARIETAGGRVESPDVEMPFGTFFYACDPDGNRIGLFRPATV